MYLLICNSSPLGEIDQLTASSVLESDLDHVSPESSLMRDQEISSSSFHWGIQSSESLSELPKASQFCVMADGTPVLIGANS